MLFIEPPEHFEPAFEAVSCFVEYEGKILLLLRQDHKSEGNKWGVPAGKIDVGEGMDMAMVRELQEETGLETRPEDMRYIQKVFVRYPDYDFLFHMFYTKRQQNESIVIETKEHKAYHWAKPEEALAMRLVKDTDSCVKIFMEMISTI